MKFRKSSELLSTSVINLRELRIRFVNLLSVDQGVYIISAFLEGEELPTRNLKFLILS